jgi:transcriptional regulator with XRE-family HTH domain
MFEIPAVKDLVNRINEYIGKEEISKYEFAKRAGISSQLLWSIMSNKIKQPKNKTIKLIENILDKE